MVEYLRAISKKHSISKVKASLFLPQSIIRPDKVFDELKEHPDFQRYQKKSLRKSRTIELNSLDSTKTSTEEKIEGFILEQYNSEGVLVYYLSIQNEQNRSTLTFESRVYTVWKDFFTRFEEDVIFMSAFLKIYIEIISLTYVDEFIWMHPSKVPVEKIFNIESDLLNKKFLDSENGSIIMLSQNMSEKSEEKTEISFSNRLRRVSVNHQYAERLKENPISSFEELRENDVFKNKFSAAHDSNKNMLRNLLSEVVKKKIGLN